MAMTRVKAALTREQVTEKWDGMTPRERDAWVAEVVTGVERKKKRVPCPDGIEGCAVAHYAYYPHYTTDITAAWEVVDKSAEWGGMELGCFNKPNAKIYVACTYTDTAPDQRLISITKESASEAVCLTALVAKLTESSV